MNGLFEVWEGIRGKGLIHCLRCDKHTLKVRWENTACATGTCRRAKRRHQAAERPDKKETSIHERSQR